MFGLLPVTECNVISFFSCTKATGSRDDDPNGNSYEILRTQNLIIAKNSQHWFKFLVSNKKYVCAIRNLVRGPGSSSWDTGCSSMRVVVAVKEQMHYGKYAALWEI